MDEDDDVETEEDEKNESDDFDNVQESIHVIMSE